VIASRRARLLGSRMPPNNPNRIERSDCSQLKIYNGRGSSPTFIPVFGQRDDVPAGGGIFLAVLRVYNRANRSLHKNHNAVQ
jgi:hypothetical protein